MIRTLIPPALDPPYLLVEIVAGLYHLTVLPADFGDDDLEAVARAQVRANRLDACLVLGERRVLAIDAEGVERRETEVSFRLFGHWISAAVTRRLKTARPLPPTDELLRREAALDAAIKAYPASRAEALRQRGMLPPADFVVGDLTKGGRGATPAELAVLSGREPSGVPVGLLLCGDCVKCLVKLWLFAARIAGEGFPARSHRYLVLAKSLVPPRPVLWSFTDLREEVDGYIKCVGAEGGILA